LNNKITNVNVSVWLGAEGKQVERGMSTADIVRNNAGTHEPLPAAKLVRELEK